MSIDLTGGIDPAREFVFAERPDDPEMRDSVSLWIVDDRGELGLPRIGIEAVGGHWEEHGLQVNVAFADGLVFRLRSDGKAWPPMDATGRPTVLGAGPLGFRCVEPFRTWTMTFDGEAAQTSTLDLLEGNTAGPFVEVRFDVETSMAVPPWIQGSLVPEARALLQGGEGNLMGGPRYEQLLRASGTIQIPGREHTFNGSGLRIRRQGVRHLAEFRGHCWQSALFPSGRAFGYIAYPPRDDGQPTFNEGYVFEGDGALIPARVAQAPWLTSLQALGQDVSLVLETEKGIERIEGETFVSTFDIRHDDQTRAIKEMSTELPDFPPLQQAGVRYRWNGEETFGMLERSSPRSKIAPQGV
jgi:prepilin-type processing-associated H-X9-DG protein